jgi:hypothetical protein
LDLDELSCFVLEELVHHGGDGLVDASVLHLAPQYLTYTSISHSEIELKKIKIFLEGKATCLLRMI